MLMYRILFSASKQPLVGSWMIGPQCLRKPKVRDTSTVAAMQTLSAALW